MPQKSQKLRDSDIRKAVVAKLVPRLAGVSPSRLVNEFGVNNGAARADLALLNGRMHGFEIKSDADSLRRLATQSAVYSDVFDTMRLICGRKHLDEAIEKVPDWWEVLVAKLVNGQVSLTVVRRGRANTTQSPRALLRLLWLEELRAFAADESPCPGLGRMKCRELWEHLANSLSKSVIRTHVREALKARTVERPDPPQK